MTDTLAPSLMFPAADAALRRRGQGVRPLLPHEFDWTEAHVAVLIRMWAEGATQSQIATAIGHPSRSGVAAKIKRLGLCRYEQKPPKKPTPERPRGRQARTYLPQCKADPFVSAAELPKGRLYFEDLTRDVCHFPVGSPPYLFCGSPTDVQPYCASCAAIARAPR